MAYTVNRYTLSGTDDVLVKWIIGSFEPGSSFPPHSHYTLELSMILSGEGEYWVDGRVYPMQAGDIVLLSNDESHCMRNTGHCMLQNAALEFEPRFIWTNPSCSFQQDFLSVFFHRSQPFCNRLDRENTAFPSIQQQFLQMQEEFVNPQPHGEAVVKARLMGILADILRYYDIVQPLPSYHDQRYTGMEQVLTYISEHYSEPISLATLADILHVNKTYFSQVFRERNGISPHEYIVKMRIAAASQQLKSSDDSVLEIAQSCGFNSLSNFYSAFKRITGKSPTQYRQCPVD